MPCSRSFGAIGCRELTPGEFCKKRQHLRAAQSELRGNRLPGVDAGWPLQKALLRRTARIIKVKRLAGFIGAGRILRKILCVCVLVDFKKIKMTAVCYHSAVIFCCVTNVLLNPFCFYQIRVLRYAFLSSLTRKLSRAFCMDFLCTKSVSSLCSMYFTA